jgi:hypothetical protein
MKTDIMHSSITIRANPLKSGGAKPPVYGIRSYDSGATEAMIDCKSKEIGGRLDWPEACSDGACGNNKKKLYRAHPRRTR